MYENDRYRQRMVERKEKAVKGVKTHGIIAGVGLALSVLSGFIPGAIAAKLVVNLAIRLVSSFTALSLMQLGYHTATATRENKAIKKYDKERAEAFAEENYRTAEYTRTREQDKQIDTLEPTKEEEKALEVSIESSNPEIKNDATTSKGHSQDDGGRTL